MAYKALCAFTIISLANLIWYHSLPLQSSNSGLFQSPQTSQLLPTTGTLYMLSCNALLSPHDMTILRKSQIYRSLQHQ